MIMKRHPLLLEKYKKIRFVILFFSLLLSIGLAPVLDRSRFQAEIITVFLALNLIAVLISVSGPRMCRLFLGLTLLTLVMQGLRAVFSLGPLLPAGDGLWVLLSLLASVVMLRHVLTAKVINGDLIFAALSVYVLFGVICGVIYFAAESLFPGSLRDSSAALSSSGTLRFQQTLYFSFVTLGTLGYGDILPVSDEMRSLAIIETLCGQAYLTVLVAWLVSMYSASNKGPAINR